MGDNDWLPKLADLLLRDIAQNSDHPSQEIASRIVQQMDVDVATQDTYRKPLSYLSVSETGIAIAIAIDDRFWTAEW